jgi:KUP system potassium uptake protein
VDIEHTSEREIGQIYVPAVNWALMLACIGLVLGFRSSSNLAAAYGVAVTTTMVVTTILFYVVARERWKWSLPVAVSLCVLFLAIDVAFWSANMIKIPDGGWFPLAVAGGVFALMTTWKTGRTLLGRKLAASSIPVRFFLADIQDNPPPRVPGTAVFMYGDPEGTPPALLRALEHFGALHERVVLLHVLTEEIPRVPPADRSQVEKVDEGCYRIGLRYGFMEDPDVPADLANVRLDGLELDPMRTTYFLGRETVLAAQHRAGMATWREVVFGFMSRNARAATSFFRLPPDRVVELGAQVEI